MLKSCPKRLAEMMPKQGRFVAIYLDVDTEIEPVGEKHEGLGVKPFDKEEFIWIDDKLYYWNEYHWIETTPQKRADYYKTEAEAVMFVPYPTQTVTLEPIKTLEELEAEAEAKRDAFAMMYGGRQGGKTFFPAAAVAAPTKAFELELGRW